ncbi:unnamed protein product [Caenorhabditis auriculariae]|uniref:Uncharacterized protein n=1 Tax=Caenorhabditis auriculariae TaxID=2777116 RepID=A0A8S1H836_9PELO|nr:unnamed protein product [Caenorhabditis auriculariae]
MPSSVLFSLIALQLLFPSIDCVQCFTGSRGEVKGIKSESFVGTICDQGLSNCFYSHNKDFTEMTASCEKLETQQLTKKACKAENGCFTGASGITVCCCNGDFCNDMHQRKRLS